MFSSLDNRQESVLMNWLNEQSRLFLERDYLMLGVTAEQRIKQIAENAERILEIPHFAEKFEHYMSQGWYSLSTPVWINFGLDRGLPISCFSVDIQDDTSDILRASAEVGMMSKYGGGTAGFFGKLRPRGSAIKNNGTSNGSVSFMEIFESVLNTISQGSARRGRFAAYLPAGHGDINEFLRIRDEGNPIQELSLGVTLKDQWIQDMLDGDEEKRSIWKKIIKKREETGYPYLLFEDTVNRHKPQVYKDKDMHIQASNLCSEILEYQDSEKSFTCCLSSMNLLYWDQWKDTDAVETLITFLDAVLTEFISKAQHLPFMEKTVRFASEHRSIGLGVLGYHSLLQSKMIPFESIEARMLNKIIFKTIHEKSLNASKQLAAMYGEPEMLKGYGERFTTRLAIAPTTSSSFILGQVSPSIEPLASNYFIKDVAKIKTVYKNPYLPITDWESLRKTGGSIQHLDIDQEIKDVFKTFDEISQLEIVIQAADRQVYIDQGQSLNLSIPPEVNPRDIHTLLIEAWKRGIKTLYYQRSANVAQRVSRDLLSCTLCES